MSTPLRRYEQDAMSKLIYDIIRHGEGPLQRHVIAQRAEVAVGTLWPILRRMVVKGQLTATVAKEGIFYSAR